MTEMERKGKRQERMAKVTSHPAQVDGNGSSGKQPEPHVPKSRRLPPGLALATVRCGALGGSGPWSWEPMTPLSL